MKRILIADDDRVMVTALAAHLYERGFEPVVTFDAMHATMVMGHSELSAAILDINMPGGTGLEVLRRLKANLRLQKVPVIVLTGTEDPATHAKALRLGAAIVLKKPCSNAQLTQTLFDEIQKADKKKTLTSITVPAKRTDFNVKYDRRTS
jgi:two-component system phosphate regulon response regulator PhoB